MVFLSRPRGHSLRIVGVHRDFRLWHGRPQDSGCVGGRHVLQRINNDLGRGLRVKLVDQALDLLVVLGRRPRYDLVAFSALGETRTWKRAAQKAKFVIAAPRVHPLYRVDHRRGSRIDGTFDVDGVDDLLDCFMVLGTRHGGQTLRIVGIGGQFGVRHRRLKNLRRAGGRDRLQRVNGHVRLRLLGHLVDQRCDLFVVLGRSPRHHLPRFRAGSKPSLGERGRQKANGIRRARVAHAFHRVDHGCGRCFCVACDIKLLQDGGDGLVFRRARPSG